MSGSALYRVVDTLFLWYLGRPERPVLVGNLNLVLSGRGVSLRYAPETDCSTAALRYASMALRCVRRIRLHPQNQVRHELQRRRHQRSKARQSPCRKPWGAAPDPALAVRQPPGMKDNPRQLP